MTIWRPIKQRREHRPRRPQPVRLPTLIKQQRCVGSALRRENHPLFGTENSSSEQPKSGTSGACRTVELPKSELESNDLQFR
jgi:hypothetical protein